MDAEEQPTKWSIIASGEGADRIAVQYHTGFQNEAIGDRVLLLNTAKADVHPAKIFEYLMERDAKFVNISERIKRERICIFGSSSGAGNIWKVGEQQAREDFDTIRRFITNLKIAEGDVILTVNTLGGGTGNGSIPYIINRLKYGNGVSKSHRNRFFAFGILPYDVEAPQRHFNTICGITRLLKYGSENIQNADLLILASNSQIEQKRNLLGSEEERYYEINKSIINAIDVMISPGGKASKTTVDVADYYQIPSNLGVYHFTPCISIGNDPRIFDMKTAIEFAAENPMVPLDIKTATMAYFVVRVPKRYLGNEFSQEKLNDITKEWAIKNMCGPMGGISRYCSLTYTSDRKTFDVLILLGGFSLKKVIQTSLSKYKIFAKSLQNEKVSSENSITYDDVRIIEERIKKYISHTEDLIKIAKSGGDQKNLLKEWGFK